MASNNEDSVIEAIGEAIEEVKKVYENVEATPLPRTLKEARQSKWELASAALDLASITALVQYPRHQQEVDYRRVISLDRALRLVDAMEDALVAAAVTRPDNVLRQLKGMIEGLGSVTLQTAKTIWKYGARLAFWKLLFQLVKHICVTVSVPLLLGIAKHAIETRISIEGSFRKAALPQRRGPRYSRRKETRT